MKFLVVYQNRIIGGEPISAINAYEALTQATDEHHALQGYKQVKVYSLAETPEGDVLVQTGKEIKDQLEEV